MPEYGENDLAIRHARRLIESGRFVVDTDWAQARPTDADVDSFLETHSWEEYSAWHLGVADDEPYDERSRYGYLFGDFEQVHRAGLFMCALEAERAGDDEVAEAASDLLRRLDDVRG